MSRLVLLIFLMLIGCRDILVHDLAEVEANNIIMQLYSHGITALKESQTDGKWGVSVSTSDSIAAMALINRRRLIRQVPPDTKSPSSLLASKQEQSYQYERTLSSELAYTLSAFSGVLDARVHLNIPDVDPLLGESIGEDLRGTASVLLVVDPELIVSESDVQSLVSGAAGIPKDRVEVLKSVAQTIKLETSEVEMRQNQLYSEMSGLSRLHKDWKIYLSYMTLVVVLFYTVVLLKRYYHREKLSKVEKILEKSEF